VIYVSEQKDIGEMSFEEAMKELECMVKTLEKGDQNLESSLLVYERAVVLREHCKKILEDSERRVHKIVECANGTEIEDFD
jgi:exodeoxyribonuclease VII small subunit